MREVPQQMGGGPPGPRATPWSRFLTSGVLLLAATTLARAETIAILPFANISAPATSNAPRLDWMGAAIAETVREALAARGADVLSREEVTAAYASLRLRPLAELTQASILKLAGTLKADRVLYGTFSYTSPTLMIRGRILKRQTFEQTPPLEEIGVLENLPGLEAHLSWRVLGLLIPGAAPPEAEYASLRTPVRLDAEESYIRGLLASTPEQREKDFRQAARLEPTYWRPAFELGKILMTRKSYREAATWLELVQPSDAAYPEAAFLLGISKFRSGDTLASQEIFSKLSETVPASGIFNNLGAAQSRNSLPAAAGNFRKALAADPSDSDYHFNLGYVLWKTAQFDAAADEFRAVVERFPGDTMATLLLGRSLTKRAPRKDAPEDARLLSLERIKDSFADLGYGGRTPRSAAGPAK